MRQACNKEKYRVRTGPIDLPIPFVTVSLCQSGCTSKSRWTPYRLRRDMPRGACVMSRQNRNLPRREHTLTEWRPTRNQMLLLTAISILPFGLYLGVAIGNVAGSEVRTSVVTGVMGSPIFTLELMLFIIALLGLRLIAVQIWKMVFRPLRERLHLLPEQVPSVEPLPFSSVIRWLLLSNGLLYPQSIFARAAPVESTVIFVQATLWLASIYIDRIAMIGSLLLTGPHFKARRIRVHVIPTGIIALLTFAATNPNTWQGSVAQRATKIPTQEGSPTSRSSRLIA